MKIMTKKRITYYDFLKGFAIMGVVAIHTMIFNADPYTIVGCGLAAFRNLLGCCVPLFVAISGFFLCNKNVNSKSAYKEFLVSRLRVIYIPMLVWGFPWLLLNLLQVTSFGALTYNIFMYFVGGLSILYFIALIIELYMQLPAIQRINRSGVIVLAIISILATFVWSLVNFVTNLHVPLIVYCSFPTYIGYFALGCYLGRARLSPNMCMAVSIVIVGSVLSVLESYYWLDLNPRNNWLGLKASVQMLAFGIISLLFTRTFTNNYKSTRYTHIIEWFGSQSMPIYMSHMLLLFALKLIGFAPNLWVTNWAVIFLLDVFFIFILTKILPNRILSYLGIR